MKTVKSLVLSIDEISDLLLISSPQVRNAAVKALYRAATAPDYIFLEEYANEPEIVQNLVKKVKGRVDAVKKRNETRAKNKQKHKEELLCLNPADESREIEVTVDEKMSRYLRWIATTYGKMVSIVRHVIAVHGLKDNPAARKLSVRFSEICRLVADYIRPLVEVGQGFYDISRDRRPIKVIMPMNP